MRGRKEEVRGVEVYGEAHMGAGGNRNHGISC